MKTFIGIDCGSSLTKVIEAGEGKGVFDILTLKYFKTPFLKDGTLDFTAFFQQLEAIIPVSRLRSAELGFTLPSTSVNYIHFDFPKLPKNELTRGIVAEARKKILPAPAPNDNIKYIVLQETKLKEGIQLRVFAGAAEKIMIDKFYGAFKNKGITPHFIGSSEMCLYAFFSECYADTGSNWAFVNMGAKNTTFTLFVKGSIAFVRNISFAGDDIVQAIAKQKKIDAEQATQLLWKNEVEEAVLTNSWNYLLSEIRRSFAYYKSIASTEEVSSILLSGGFLKVASLSAFLKTNLRGNVSFFDLAHCKKVSTKRISAEEVTSVSPFFLCGLGIISALAITRPLINFLPEEVAQKKKAQQLDILAIKALGVFTGLLLIVLLVVNIILMRNNARAFPQARQDMMRSRYDALNKMMTEIRVKQRSYTQQITFVETVKRFSFSWDKVFTLVSQAVPADIYMKELFIRYEERASQPVLRMVLQGRVLADFEKGVRILDDFAQKLRSSNRFVEFKSTPLPLEDIVVQPASGQKALTSTKEREFTIEGVINKE